MNLTTLAAKNSSLFRFGAVRFALAALALTATAASLRAGVYLGSYSFTANRPPIVYTDEPLSTPYKLRVKIMGVPGYDDGFHAANAYNNNWTQISLPPPGIYCAYLYGSSPIIVGEVRAFRSERV